MEVSPLGPAPDDEEDEAVSASRLTDGRRLAEGSGHSGPLPTAFATWASVTGNGNYGTWWNRVETFSEK